MPFQITNGNDLTANSGNFSYLTVNGIPVSTGVTSGGGSNVTISNYGSGRVLLSDGTSSGILAQSGLLFTSGNLYITGVPVSISGHAHTASQITNFNSAVSGLLPALNIVTGSGRVFTSDGSSSGIIGQSGLTFINNRLTANGVIINNGNNLYMWSNFR